MAVVNLFADQLTFLSDNTRTRRDHMKYLTLIRCIALLHQHQRPVRHIEHRCKPLAYIEVLKNDIVLASQSHHLIPDAVLPIPFRSQHLMMRSNAKVEKVYLYPKPVDFRKSIDGLAALVELDIKVAVFDLVLFVFLNKPRNRVKIWYWERNGFCLWQKRLESERFETSPDCSDEAIVLTVQELNWLLDGFDFKLRMVSCYRPCDSCQFVGQSAGHEVRVAATEH